MVDIKNNDQLLWQDFKKGDHGSFAQLYDLHFNSLYAYGLRIADDRDLVKDSIHDLFVKLWMNRKNLADVEHVKAYLLVSLRGTLFNKIAKDARMQTSGITENEHFDLAFSVESAYIKQENETGRSRLLLEAMNQISPRQKEVIYLRFFEELEYDQVASILNISTKATYKLAARALDALRQIIHLPGVLLILSILFQNISCFVG
jgi:RNA polymerase sigma factor (sigma-70 family)